MFKSEHKFKTSKEDKKINILHFILAFLAFLLIFGTVSAVVILKHNDVSMKDIFAGRETTTAYQEQTQQDPDKKLSGSADFLVYSADTDSSEIYFLAVISADMENESIKVCPLNPDREEYLRALSDGGHKALVNEVQKSENRKIDKYIASNAHTFSLAINYMNGLPLDVSERIEYRTDEFTLILTEGKQTVKGETLLKYMRYCKTLGEDGLTKQGKILCAMIDTYINEENVKDGVSLYQEILSQIHSESDISYVEAAEAMQTLEAFCKSERRQPAEVVFNTQSVTE